MPRRRPEQPVLITSAQESRLAEMDARRRRYLWSMGFRTVCFLLSVLLLHGPAQWIAIGVSLVLPWIAVVAANAGPRRVAETPSYYEPAQRRGLAAGQQPEPDHDERRRARR